MAFELPKLPYAYDALEPVIDAQTMELHHSKHHQTYVDKLNLALEKNPDWQDKTVEEFLIQLETLPDELKVPVRQHGGGHANHSLFWQIMSPVGSSPTEPTGPLSDAINAAFGSFAVFKEQFTNVAMNQFGSGWAWLVKDKQGDLKVYSLLNQLSPLTDGHTPILGLDVWEHAYYLKYQNRRKEYVDAWWQLVNWNKVSELFV
jgi:Fe-Mn family superoxide dismutase